MQKYNELTYINRIGLQNLKRTQGGFVCTCPKCGTATPWKKKLYILTENKSFITVFCQKCGINTNLKSFIRDYNSMLYEEYCTEERKDLIHDLKNGTLFQKERKTSEINTIIDLKYQFHLNHKYFKPAKEYKEAWAFCKKRNILEHIDKLYYNIHPKHILSGMVIFPFFLEDQSTLYGLQGRHTDVKLFHTFSKNESMKIYNIYNVDLNSPVYIFESIIDSLMVENAIAMLGTSLSKAVSDMIKYKIFITDNDNEGRKRTLKYLQEGHKCFIFPNDFKWKDFNEGVCKGFPKENLPRLIKENTYQGLLGITKIQFKMMGKK